MMKGTVEALLREERVRLEAGCEGKEGEQGRTLLGTCLKVKGPLRKELKSGCHASKSR